MCSLSPNFNAGPKTDADRIVELLERMAVALEKDTIAARALTAANGLMLRDAEDEIDRLRHYVLLSQDTLDSAVRGKRVTLNDFGKTLIRGDAGVYEAYYSEIIHPLTGRCAKSKVDAALAALSCTPTDYIDSERNLVWLALRADIMQRECAAIMEDQDEEESDT